MGPIVPLSLSLLLCKVELEQGLRSDAGVMLLIASTSPGQGQKLSHARLGLLLLRLPQAVCTLRKHRGLLQVFRGPGQHEDPQAQPRVQSWPVWRELGMGILRSDRWVIPQPPTHCLSWAWDIQCSGSSWSQCPQSAPMINILGISELKWTGMGEFNSDDHYICYCGQESLRRNRIAIMVNKRV